MKPKIQSIFFPVLLLFAFPFIISLCYGFQYRFVESGMESYFRIWSALWLVAMGGMTLYVLKSWIVPGTLPTWIGLSLSSLSLALTSYFYLSKVANESIWISFALIPAMLAIWLNKRNAILGIRLLGLAGLVLNFILIAKVPHTTGANMLQIIEAAITDFLAGKYPYLHVYEGIASLPFGYLPGLWLPYVPLVWLGLDVRILNVLAVLLVAWLFERSLDLKSDQRAAILGATLYPLLLSPPVSQVLVHGHIWPYWVFVLAAIFFLKRYLYSLAAIFLGFALAARQPALWLVPPLIGYLGARLGWLDTLKYAVLTVAVYFIVVLPFALPGGAEFWQLTYLRISSSGFTNPQIDISALVWLELGSLNSLLRPMQISVLLGAMIWLYLRKINFAYFVMILGLSYLWTTYFNNYTARYVYIPGLLLLIMGFIIHLSPSSKKSNFDLQSDTTEQRP